MSTADTRRRYTYDDLADFPDDGLRRELIDGELIVSASPVTRHQRVVRDVLYELVTWCREHGGEAFPAPLDVKFSEDTVLEPDVLVLTPGQVSGDPRFIDVPPAIVVEVSSPSTRRTDLVRKRRVYEREGCAEFWFVDLDAERIEVYALDAGAYGPPTILERGAQITTPQLPGLDVAVDELLGRPEVEAQVEGPGADV
jgi:Uma2 family endonuclease